MMKRLLNSPPSLPLPPPDKMLNNIFWLRNDQSLVSYIKVVYSLKAHVHYTFYLMYLVTFN